MASGEVVPGDTVVDTDGGPSLVVVDVTSDGFAVCRDPEDLVLQYPKCLPVSSLVVDGHLSAIPGWMETTHGQWEQAQTHAESGEGE